MGPLAKVGLWILRSPVGQYLLAKALGMLTDAIRAWKLKREVAKRNEEIQKAANALKAANKILDKEARINAKADALCRLEKLSNPKSDCDQ